MAFLVPVNLLPATLPLPTNQRGRADQQRLHSLGLLCFTHTLQKDCDILACYNFNWPRTMCQSWQHLNWPQLSGRPLVKLCNWRGVVWGILNITFPPLFLFVLASSTDQGLPACPLHACATLSHLLAETCCLTLHPTKQIRLPTSASRALFSVQHGSYCINQTLIMTHLSHLLAGKNILTT